MVLRFSQNSRFFTGLFPLCGNAGSAALIIGALVIPLLLQGCAEKTTQSLSQRQLQTLIDDNFLSPRILPLSIAPWVGAQLYIKTPQVTVRDDGQPLGFSIAGLIDVDFMGNAVKKRLPIQLTGVADLMYDSKEQAFFFQNIQLQEAHLKIDIVMFETLIIEQLRKAITKALATLAIIPLNDASALLKSIAGRAVSVSTASGELRLTFKEPS
ncbi:hypothetical protein [Candidatus Sororendozoicomonas aggregata]|uniref:hypothetical protein n=1 Tax=Candidatus Sororendozoicomonas aggregata TaxID=3073239 RepID=UPI002ECFB894